LFGSGRFHKECCPGDDSSAAFHILGLLGAGGDTRQYL
jgi:hypothetical protein